MTARKEREGGNLLPLPACLSFRGRWWKQRVLVDCVHAAHGNEGAELVLHGAGTLLVRAKYTRVSELGIVQLP